MKGDWIDSVQDRHQQEFDQCKVQQNPENFEHEYSLGILRAFSFYVMLTTGMNRLMTDAYLDGKLTSKFNTVSPDHMARHVIAEVADAMDAQCDFCCGSLNRSGDPASNREFREGIVQEFHGKPIAPIVRTPAYDLGYAHAIENTYHLLNEDLKSYVEGYQKVANPPDDMEAKIRCYAYVVDQLALLMNPDNDAKRIIAGDTDKMVPHDICLSHRIQMMMSNDKMISIFGPKIDQ